MFAWVCGTAQKSAGRLCGLTAEHTKVDWYQFFRDICSWKLENTPGLFRLGGPGRTVQIDESVVTKRKYNRGRVVPERWVLGIYDCLLKRGVVVYVEFRDAATLRREIARYVQPGTEIWTDGWAAYRGLDRLPGMNYVHHTVNHSENFVDPVTGVCTNAVEAYWSRLKGFCRRNGVMQSGLLPSHIDEFMWREVYDQGSVSETWQSFLDHLREKHDAL
jgi:hypothetical protein